MSVLEYICYTHNLTPDSYYVNLALHYVGVHGITRLDYLPPRRASEITERIDRFIRYNTEFIKNEENKGV